MAARPHLAHTFRAIHDKADLNLCPSTATLHQLQAQNFRVCVCGRVAWIRHSFIRNGARRRGGSGLLTVIPLPTLLLYVGRLSLEKRVDWLRPLLDQFPHVRLAIVGDGPARDKLEQLFAGTPTHFTGYLRSADLAHAYAAADAFTFPSAHETLGNVVLEAMASGLPVVVARSGGPLDVVTQGQNGLFFDPDDPADFAAQVGRALADVPLAIQLGQQARQTAVRRSWTQVLDGLLADYAEIGGWAGNGGQPYFNTGNGIHPGVLTGLEIGGGA
ncbi:MAG: glycosyltransferase [Chloroflexota bacterium]